MIELIGMKNTIKLAKELSKLNQLSNEIRDFNVEIRKEFINQLSQKLGGQFDTAHTGEAITFTHKEFKNFSITLQIISPEEPCVISLKFPLFQEVKIYFSIHLSKMEQINLEPEVKSPLDSEVRMIQSEVDLAKTEIERLKKVREGIKNGNITITTYLESRKTNITDSIEEFLNFIDTVPNSVVPEPPPPHYAS